MLKLHKVTIKEYNLKDGIMVCYTKYFSDKESGEWFTVKYNELYPNKPDWVMQVKYEGEDNRGM